MDVKRAQDIIASNEKIQVHYNGQSIWIAGVNPSKNTANIKTNIFEKETMEVSLNELKEIH